MKRFYTFLIALLLIVFLTACTGPNSSVEQPKEIESGIQEGQMFFYGEGTVNILLNNNHVMKFGIFSTFCHLTVDRHIILSIGAVSCIYNCVFHFFFSFLPFFLSSLLSSFCSFSFLILSSIADRVIFL